MLFSSRLPTPSSQHRAPLIDRTAIKEKGRRFLLARHESVTLARFPSPAEEYPMRGHFPCFRRPRGMVRLAALAAVAAALLAPQGSPAQDTLGIAAVVN